MASAAATTIAPLPVANKTCVNGNSQKQLNSTDLQRLLKASAAAKSEQERG